MLKDRNFDDLADKFSRNIYDTTKGAIRQKILWQDLQQSLQLLPQRPLRILDAGGGEGRMACRLAALGHQVILCDISENMLRRAEQHSERQGVRQQIQLLQCSVQQVSNYLEKPVDLILLHAVLEWMVEPKAALISLSSSLCAGGVFSVLFFNQNGLLLRNVILGNLSYIKAGMPKRKKRSLLPTTPLLPEQVYDWLISMNLQLIGKTGIRVFHDYLHNKQQQQDNFAELLFLEQSYCRQEPFISLGRYIHVMARKPL